MGIFSVLRHLHRNPILDLLAIARLAEIDWDVTVVELFSLDYERSRFIFIPLVSRVTRKRAEGSEVTKGGRDKICAV